MHVSVCPCMFFTHVLPLTVSSSQSTIVVSDSIQLIQCVQIVLVDHKVPQIKLPVVGIKTGCHVLTTDTKPSATHNMGTYSCPVEHLQMMYVVHTELYTGLERKVQSETTEVWYSEKPSIKSWG